MRQTWLALVVALCVCVVAASLNAQPMNMNTHEGKYSTGGFGFGVGFGLTAGSSFRREIESSKTVGGVLEAVFKKRDAQNMKRSIFGADIEFQIGSDNNIVGTNFELGVRIHNISSDVLRVDDPDASEFISESATVLRFGLDLTIEFYSSEFIETDGRRTREAWGLALYFGPTGHMMMGSFSDLNGFAAIGLNIGMMADFPISIPGAEDLLSVSPWIGAQVNYHLDIDGGLLNPDNTQPTFLQEMINDNFDFGFWESTKDLNGDGIPDVPGIAIRRHHFIPSYNLSFGADVNVTPIFVARSGSLINNWRFRLTTVFNFPIALSFFGTSFVGDSMWNRDAMPASAFISIGAAYFF